MAVALFFSPVWVGAGWFAYMSVARLGEPALLSLLVATHLGWLASAFLFAAFAEGFSWRLLLRFPIRPASIFWINVLLAPFDFVGLFILPPLVGATVAVAVGRGGAAALGVGAGFACALLVTSIALQTFLAVLGSFVRQPWARALGGLVFGLACALPALAWSRHMAVAQGSRATWESMIGAAAPAMSGVATLAAWLPPTAFPSLLVRGALAASAAKIALGVSGSVVVLLAGAWIGTRLAVKAAVSPEIAGGEVPVRAGWPLAWTPGSQLGVLVARELRYWLRTPQVLIGLVLPPFMVAMFFTQSGTLGVARLLFLPFFCLTAIFNLSANHFGLDREGVRLLFLLPIEPRRLLLGKNLAAAVLVAMEVALCSAAATFAGRAVRATEVAESALSVFATLPVALAAGNYLSARFPWRMTFKVGGTPPGAMASALTQMCTLVAMAVLLAIPAVAARLLVGPPATRTTIEFGGILAIGACGWAAWSWSLPRAARRLMNRREHLLGTLAHAHETG